MASMDIFTGDAFSAISLSTAVDKMDYVPSYLGNIPGLFTLDPVRTRGVWIEERAYGPSVIKTTPRGSEIPQRGLSDKRKARNFETVRVAEGDTLSADELQGIRAFGSETELKQVADEVARRQMKLGQSIELTFEHMRLGTVQGILTDADGSTIVDWASALGQTTPTGTVDFTLATDGTFRAQCATVKRSVVRGLKGPVPSGIMAICGDDFWDAMVKAGEVRDTYLGYPGAAFLREDSAWTYGGTEAMEYGGITWTNYRGTDDGTSVAVAADEAHIFPIGAGIFRQVQAPGETFDLVNTLGQRLYSAITPDQRNRFVTLEVMSYPLFVCTMPQALYKLSLA